MFPSESWLLYTVVAKAVAAAAAADGDTSAIVTHIQEQNISAISASYQHPPANAMMLACIHLHVVTGNCICIL